jgi:hypothetical protein
MSLVDNIRFPSGWHMMVVVRTRQSLDRVNLTRFCVSIPLLFVVFCFLFVYVVLFFKLRMDNSRCDDLSLTAS